MIYTVVPIVVFVVANALVALPIAIGTAVVVALVLTALRAINGEPIAQASGGLAGVLAACTQTPLTISIAGDPTTPYAGGISLAKTLGGRMLTGEGERHTIASVGTSKCVDDIVAAYLIDLETSPAQARCAL